jgi:DNA-binding response OmpR family regulator
MTTETEPVCVLAMATGTSRDHLASELTIDGYGVRSAQSVAEVESRLTAAHADVLVVGTLIDPAQACALLRGLRAGRLCEGRIAPDLAALEIVPDGELTSLLRAFECGADDVVAQPVRYAELRARLGALCRRARQGRMPQHQRIAELEPELDIPEGTMRA